MQQTKRCSKCGLTLPLTTEYFSKNQSTNTGGDKYFRPECKACTTKARRGCAQAKKHAGYPRKPVPGTPCDCCGRDDMLLIFDHDHVSLAHRGWICQNCNQGLGRLAIQLHQSLVHLTTWNVHLWHQDVFKLVTKETRKSRMFGLNLFGKLKYQYELHCCNCWTTRLRYRSNQRLWAWL